MSLNQHAGIAKPRAGDALARRVTFVSALLPLLVSCSLLSGCAVFQPSSVSVEEKRLEEELRVVTTKYKKLQETVAARNGGTQQIDPKLAKVQLLLLEKEAQIKELRHRIDDAILEVVRAKAKLRSLESKAEAASTMAEAEIALKSLKGVDAGPDKHPAFHHAGEFLRMATVEFKKENFGGALYLSTQAKGQIKEGEELQKGREKTALVPGEVPFTLPLPLRLVDSIKLRGGPTQDAKLLAGLEKATLVLGISHKGEWIRVKAEDGQNGWIYFNQVELR
jgi:hypothetical protein